MYPIAVYVAGGSGNITDTIISSYGYGIGVLGGASASEDYNLFYQVPITYDGAVATGSHHPHGDPRFADPAHDNYRLLLGSAAYNAGVDVGITRDFFGTGRPSFGGYDIGYHEINDTPINNLTAANTSPTRRVVSTVAAEWRARQTRLHCGPPCSRAFDLSSHGEYASPHAAGVTGELPEQVVESKRREAWLWPLTVLAPERPAMLVSKSGWV